MSKSTENTCQEIHYFTIYRKMMKISGVCLYGKNTRMFKLYTLVVFIGYVIYIVGTTKQFISNENRSLIDIIFSMGASLTTFRYIEVLRNKDRLRNVLQQLESGIFLPDGKRGGEKELNLINKWMNNFALVGKLIVATSITIISISLLSWYLNKSQKWPFGYFFVIGNYEISVVLQTIIFSNVVITHLALDSTFLVSIGHILVHLINLRHYFEDIRKSDKENGRLVSNWNILKKRLKIGVDYHNAIFSVSEGINDAYKYSELFVFLSTSFVLCVLIYDISFRSSYDSVFLLEIFYACAVIVTIWLPCYCGNVATNKSLEIGNVCAKVEFVGTDVRFQKSLIFIIQRSQKPIIFQIGVFGNLTLGTALSVMRASYSYFMFLYNIHQNSSPN